MTNGPQKQARGQMRTVRQNYKSHHKSRSRARQKSVQLHRSMIEKNKDAKILVILHLFYPMSWIEIKEYLDNLSCYHYELIVTVTNGMIPDAVIAQIRDFKPDVRIIECENKGFDVRPFMMAIQSVDLHKYDVVVKLQSKSTKRRWIFIYNQLFLRRDWFLDLFEGILSPENVHQNIDTLLHDPEIGLVAARNLIVHDPSYKEELVRRIARKHNVIMRDHYEFVAGTCFMAKAETLEVLKNIKYSDSDFDSWQGANGNTRGMSFAHFLERYMCTSVSDQGYAFKGNDIRIKRHKFLEPAAKVLRRYSSANLLTEDIEFDPEWFYWQLDNQLITWKYKKVPIKKLKHCFDFKVTPLLETQPYRYLKGDVEGYKKYCDFHQKNGLPVMSVERFEKLRKSIARNGYNPRNIIIVSPNNVIMDGQHRACCLCEQLGEDASVKVLQVHILRPKEILRERLPMPLQKKIHDLRHRNDS